MPTVVQLGVTFAFDPDRSVITSERRGKLEITNPASASWMFKLSVFLASPGRRQRSGYADMGSGVKGRCGVSPLEKGYGENPAGS
jgi:hypothetical protein